MDGDVMKVSAKIYISRQQKNLILVVAAIW